MAVPLRPRSLAPLLAALVLLACAGEPPDPLGALYAGVTREQNLAMRESPLLRARVAAGELPPVEARLPENPMVVPVVDRLGTYGGTWHHYHTNPDQIPWRLINNYWGLTRWNPEVDDIIPGLAESWEFNEAGNEVTFHLRRGVKWSDGAPFTSADIAFWWDLCTDERAPVFPPEWAFSRGERMEVLTPDPYTVVFRFREPCYFLPIIMATGFWTPESIILPAHYLRQFHPDESSAHEGFTELLRRADVVTNPERPTLAPWRLASITPTGHRVVYERNPFYWAVDPAGRQLPYIDRVETLRVQNRETGVLMILSGDIDAQFRLVAQADIALLKRFRRSGGYRILRWEEGTASWHAVFLNWSPPDPRDRRLFRRQPFRAALAHAIDRERINQVVWDGLSRPQAAAITDESWHFRSERGQRVLREWITKWSEYDPGRASRLLDEAGLAERDAEGFRMFEGEPFHLILDTFDDPIAIDEGEMIAEDWRAVGLRTYVRRATGAEIARRIPRGDFQMYMQHNSEMDLFTFPSFVFPVQPNIWHPREGRYYATGGREGEPPEGFMAELVELYDRAKTEPDPERRHQLALDAIEIQLREGPFMLGTSGRQFDPVIVRNNFRNVPETGILGPWAIAQPASKFPEQFFIDIYADPQAPEPEGAP